VADVILFGLTHPHSNAHLKTLMLSDSVSTLGVCDQDSTVASNTGAENPGVTAAFEDVGSAISEGNPEVGVACLPNDKNADLCVALLEAGIHVISEKPIGASVSDVSRVVDAAKANGLRLGVMYQNRFHPLSQEARRIVQSGTIGRVTGCEARLITSQVQFRNPDHWLFEKDVAGGGILSWLGCHYLDLLRYVTGAEITDVSAFVGTLSGESIDVEDVATVSLRFDGGFLGSLQAGYQLALSRSGYMGPNYETYMSVRGTEGRVVWEPSSGDVKLLAESTQWTDSPSRVVTFSLPTVDAYGGSYGLAFVDQFIASTTSQEIDPPADGTDALQIAKVIEAAYISSESGEHKHLSS
jgi:predicted dehydrogenase